MMLAHPDSAPLLVDIANTILMPRDPFEVMTVLNPEIPKEDIDHKGITLDILATTARGAKIQVEMQARHHAFFKERAFYYATRLHSSQLTRGENYDELKPTYCINFLRFNQFSVQDTGPFAHIFEMRERTTHIPLTSQFEIHFLELLKFQIFLMKNPQGSGNPHLDNWLHFLLNPSDKRLEVITMSDPIINRAMKRLKDISNDDYARERARVRERAEHDWASMLSDARREGLAEGKAEGLADGKAEGKSEARLEFLRTLLTSPITGGLSDEALAEMVHLPRDLVEQMREQIKRG
jgi:predicted transposase/invertase (TIGR01784 family)